MLDFNSNLFRVKDTATMVKMRPLQVLPVKLLHVFAPPQKNCGVYTSFYTLGLFDVHLQTKSSSSTSRSTRRWRCSWPSACGPSCSCWTRASPSGSSTAPSSAPTRAWASDPRRQRSPAASSGTGAATPAATSTGLMNCRRS